MIKNLFSRKSGPAVRGIVVVSGLPRSGTSMMMKMLAEGGLPVVTDSQRTADDDNPNGYFELERVKQMTAGDTGWLADAQGKAVKVVSALLEHLPTGFRYKVVFMERSLDEVLASQKKMLQHRSEGSSVSDAEMKAQFGEHLKAVKYWLARQPHIEVLYVDYARLVASPRSVGPALSEFLEFPLDLERMQAVPSQSLYRNRAPG